MRASSRPSPNQINREGKTMRYKGLRIGDKVHKEMGVRMEGIVSAPFYWKQSTDGTYSEPKKNYIPITWNDGTFGYCHTSHLARRGV